MGFAEFVEIRLREADSSTYDYKAMKSFADSIGNDPGGADEAALLKNWATKLIDNNFTPSSMRRYVEKLGTIYRRYNPGAGSFDPIKQLAGSYRECRPSVDSFDNERVDRTIAAMVKEAPTSPSLAVFCYLMFEVSADVESVVNLTVDQFQARYPQLSRIVDTENFHHRRRYVFDLGQGRVRMPQIVRRITGEVESFFDRHGVRFEENFTLNTVLALWIAQARRAGVGHRVIKSVLPVVPQEYDYLRYIDGAELTPQDCLDIKTKVAEMIMPSRQRWFAMKLHRGVTFDNVDSSLKNDSVTTGKIAQLFYPTREVSRRVDKKIVKESQPYIPDVVFFKTQPWVVANVDTLLHRKSLGWVYRSVKQPRGEYSIIDHHSMMLFQQAIGHFTDDMKVELISHPHVDKGRQVRITGGIMAGFCGTIEDIKPGSNDTGRIIYIKMTDNDYFRVQTSIPEHFISPVIPG